MSAIDRGHECSDATDFVELLRWWLESTDEEQVGDPKAYKNLYVRVPIGEVPCFLSGDTKRAGVADFLSTVDSKGAAFAVVANKNGVLNRVGVGRDQEVIKRFFLYTVAAQTAPVVLV